MNTAEKIAFLRTRCGDRIAIVKRVKRWYWLAKTITAGWILIEDLGDHWHVTVVMHPDLRAAYLMPAIGADINKENGNRFYSLNDESETGVFHYDFADAAQRRIPISSEKRGDRIFDCVIFRINEAYDHHVVGARASTHKAA